MLREHVERLARDNRLLDLPGAHALCDHSALEQVASELREDAALRGGAELVAGAPDPLQPSRHRFRRLDLDHQVNSTHVDSELERGSRDEAGETARLQQLLDDQALLVGKRAVMGTGDLDDTQLGGCSGATRNVFTRRPVAVAGLFTCSRVRAGEVTAGPASVLRAAITR